MSTDDSPEKLHEDGTVETPEWHRARAKRLRQNGFTKMAEQHEQIAQARLGPAEMSSLRSLSGDKRTLSRPHPTKLVLTSRVYDSICIGSAFF
jgi:CHAD domain-containing protein